MIPKVCYGKDKSLVIKEIEDKIETMEKLYKNTEDYSMIQYFKGHIQAYKDCIKIIKQIK